MLVSVSDLNPKLAEIARNELEKAMRRPDVRSRLGIDDTVHSLLHDEQTRTTAPSYYEKSYVSVHDNQVLGFFKGYFAIANDGTTRCIEYFMVNSSQKMVRFGKDQLVFMQLLLQMCHRIEFSAIVDRSNEDEQCGVKGAYGNTTARHLKRYNARYVGYREKSVRALDGTWMDKMMWEIITPKGRALL